MVLNTHRTSLLQGVYADVMQILSEFFEDEPNISGRQIYTDPNYYVGECSLVWVGR